MNYERYKGVFNTDLLQGLVPSGKWDIPTIFRTDACPKRLVSFDRIRGIKTHNQWVHFFIHDYAFMRIWRNPWKYLPLLAEFEGAIAPDFSIFWNYPLFLQLESVCRSRMIGSWLQRNGVSVIPCVRWGKEDTYPFAFEGIEAYGTVAVGTVGCMLEKEPKEVFEAGFRVMLDRLSPSRVVVYGSRRSPVFTEAERRGIEIVSFQSDTSTAFSKGVM